MNGGSWHEPDISPQSLTAGLERFCHSRLDNIASYSKLVNVSNESIALVYLSDANVCNLEATINLSIPIGSVELKAASQQ